MQWLKDVDHLLNEMTLQAQSAAHSYDFGKFVINIAGGGVGYSLRLWLGFKTNFFRIFSWFLVGGLEHSDYLSIYWQLTFIIFQRVWNHQPGVFFVSRECMCCNQGFEPTLRASTAQCFFFVHYILHSLLIGSFRCRGGHSNNRYNVCLCVCVC